MINVFVYGTLMYESVSDRIVLGRVNKIKGKISGYRRLAVKGEVYPGLVKGDGEVEGYIWRDVSREDVERLDVFEGEYYQREALVAINEQGEEIEVNAYVFKDQYRHLLEDKDWSLNDFKNGGLISFVTLYKGFSRN